MAILQSSLVSGNLNVTSSLTVTGSATFLSNVSGTTAQFVTLTGSITGSDAKFTTVTGSTVTGSIAQFSQTTSSLGIVAGTSSQFEVNSSGNITKINNISYSFPSISAESTSLLESDNSGNLSWSSNYTRGTGSSTDNGIARFDGTTGKIIQDGSGVTLSDTGGFIRTGSMSFVTNGAAADISITAGDDIVISALDLVSIGGTNTTVQGFVTASLITSNQKVETTSTAINITTANIGASINLTTTSASSDINLVTTSASSDIVLNSFDDIGITAADIVSITANNAAFLQGANSVIMRNTGNTESIVIIPGSYIRRTTTTAGTEIQDISTGNCLYQAAENITIKAGDKKNIDLNISAVNIVRVDDTEVIVNKPVLSSVDYNSSLEVAYAFSSSANTGMGYDTTVPNVINFYNSGTLTTIMSSAGIVSPRFTAALGSSVQPSYSFLSDPNTGIYNPSADQISFVTSGSDRVRIDNNGKVGVGTTAPSKRLHINNSGLLIDGTNTIESSSLAARLIVDSGASTGHTLADFRNSGGSALFVGGTNVGVGTNTPGARLDVDYSGASSTTQYAAEFKSSGGTTNAGRVLFSQDNTFAMAIAPAATSLATGRIDFQYITRSTGVVSTTPLSVRGDGRIGIGTTAPSFQLQLSTDSAAKPSTNTWTISSDIRIKENVQNYTKGLETLVQINPVTYDYNGKGGFNPDIKNNVGLIAQDIKDILPESISVYKTKLNPEDTEDTELYNFNSHALTYVMINCIKQLSSEVNTLKAKIDMLSAEVADLKNNQ